MDEVEENEYRCSECEALTYFALGAIACRHQHRRPTMAKRKKKRPY